MSMKSGNGLTGIRSWRLVCGVCAALLATAPPAAYCDEIGHSTYFIQDWFQSWKTVSNESARFKRILRGTITKLQFNGPYDPPWHDGDWCIHVLPDPGYEGLLANGRHKVNSDGQIELEINSQEFPLDSFFHPNQHIEAFGWHVEDLGHNANDPDYPSVDCDKLGLAVVVALFGTGGDIAAASLCVGGDLDGGGKTELHPLISLRTREGDEERVFIGQDMSGRFQVANQELEQSFNIDVPATEFRRNLQESSWSPGGNLHSLEEEATVDHVFGWTGCPMSPIECLHEKQTIVRAEQRRFGTVEFTARLRPAVTSEQISPPMYENFYFGKFHTSVLESPLEDRVTVRVDNRQGGKQVLVGSVELRLSTNLAEEHSFASARYLIRTVGKDGKQVVREQSAPPSSTQFEFAYSPGLNMPATQATADFFASSKSANWAPGTRFSVEDPNPEPEVRRFYQERRVFAVDPSHFQVATEVQQFSCDSSVLTARAQVLKPHPSVTNTRPIWRVALLSDAFGNDIPTPVLRTVNPSQPLELAPNVSINLDASSSSVLTLNLTKAAAAIPVGPDILLRGNLARIRYVVETKTGLGESIRASGEMNGKYCVNTPHIPDIKQMELDFVKLTIALEKLKMMGIDDPVFGRPDLPWPKKLIEQWPRKIPIVPNMPPREIMREASELANRTIRRKTAIGDAQVDTSRVLRTYYSYINGRVVDPEDMRVLLLALKRAEQLPDFETR